MRFPRMTTRRWMLFVAVIALAFAGIRLADTAWSRASLARSHALVASALRASASNLENAIPQAKSEGLRQEYATTMARHSVAADYFSSLEAKYQSAARRPWLPVEPDPPLPDGVRLGH